MFKQNLYFSFCPLPLVLLLDTTDESGSVIFTPFCQVFMHMGKIPCAFSSPAWTVPALPASPHVTDAAVPWSSSWPHAVLALVCPGATCPAEPSTGTSTPHVSHQGWAGRKDHNHLPQPAGQDLNTVRMLLDCFVARVHCWLMFNLLSPRIPRSFPAELFFQPVGPLPALVPAVVPPHMQDWALPFAELHETPVALLSSLLRSLWTATQPSGLSTTLSSEHTATSLKVSVKYFRWRIAAMIAFFT